MIVSRDMEYKPHDTTMSSGVYLEVNKPPFRIYGIDGSYKRLPDDVAEVASGEVAKLAKFTAGGRVRFRTDSDYIILHCDISSVWELDDEYNPGHGLSDIYFYNNGAYEFKGTFVPSQDRSDGTKKDYLESRIRFSEGMKDVLIDLPLFRGFSHVLVGLREGSQISEASEYRPIAPLYFYGSSIVHGVGATRPGNIYPAIVSRKNDLDFVCLGFAGAARAELPLMAYIAKQQMSIFVYDYDHNAPTADYLAQTHFRGYRLFREAQPQTPVIMASKVDYYTSPEENEKRRQIILESYKKGLAAGDKNLYYVDGKDIYAPEYREESTFDNCHPNDMGYSYMAKAFGKIIADVLGGAHRI